MLRIILVLGKENVYKSPLLLGMAPGEVTFLGLARAISSLGIPFRAGMNRKVSEHQEL